ncbi:MAG TPA: ATP-binding cassette domain-containing protein [Methanotrichaceae archaeon]|nr:ATP-binding cassette domain-containing protein [Methanotrichaceae archaeon]
MRCFSTTDILEARDVRYSYADGPQALNEISVTIEQGKKVALVGPNGAGKSTLLLMFNGILRPKSGQISLKGRPLKYDSASLREIRRRVGLVFQNPDDQLFAPTVYQDVAFGPVNLGYPKEKVDRYVKYALEYVGLSGYERRPPHHLSGGEKKRVAIAGVLAMEPEVMILDEPTSNLDPASAEEMMEMLDELNSSGKTLVISTHDVELAYRWADEIVLMEHGGLMHRGPGQEVFGDVELLKRARMKMPLIMEIYRELLGRGLIDDVHPPRSVLEITDLLERKARGAVTCQSLGKIFICNVESTGPEDIKRFLGEGISCCGAMGTSAKVMAERENIGLDFTYGVIDKCILKALAGQSALIMTSGGMVDHARRRIDTYSRECGLDIAIEQLPDSEQK